MDPYHVLEIHDKNITETELKHIYRKLVLKHHPDKGGSTEKFNEITKAYQVLKKRVSEDIPINKKDSSFTVLNIVKSFVKNNIKKQYQELYLTLDEIYHGKNI